jgi:ribonuclease HI
VSTRRYLDLYFDGLCEPVNPGGVATYGWTLLDRQGVSCVCIHEAYGLVATGEKATNNVAEWSALVFGLRWLDESGRHPKHLQIYGDSQLVTKQLNGVWQMKAEHLRPAREVALKHLESVASPWTATWIPRDENRIADGLSKRAYTDETGQRAPERGKKKR